MSEQSSADEAIGQHGSAVLGVGLKFSRMTATVCGVAAEPAQADRASCIPARVTVARLGMAVHVTRVKTAVAAAAAGVGRAPVVRDHAGSRGSLLAASDSDLGSAAAQSGSTQAVRALREAPGHLDKRLLHDFEQANARRGPYQPELTLAEAKRIAHGSVGSAFAKAQERYGTQIFGVVVMSNHLSGTHLEPDD